MPAAATASKRVLLVEDEPGLVLTLTDRLKSEGYDVQSASDGPSGLERATRERWDVILLDVMLPGASGFDVCRDLRQRGVTTPVIMLTARGQVVDKVLGLKLGADDYLTKPFDMMELTARIEVQLRRAPRPRRRTATQYRFGDIARGLPQGRGHRARPVSSISRRASSCCSSTSSSIARRRSRATSCSTKSGAITRCRRRARWTCTSRGCVRRSSRTRGTRSTSLTVHGMGYKFIG